MKQKIVIKVSMSGQKKRSKAMKIAVGVAGVESAALKGDDKNQIEVIGDGVDAVCLATLLRKNVGYAELESISEVKPENKDDKKDEKKDDEKKVNEWNYNNMVWTYGGGMPVYHVQEIIRDNAYYRSDPCSIM